MGNDSQMICCEGLNVIIWDSKAYFNPLLCYGLCCEKYAQIDCVFEWQINYCNIHVNNDLLPLCICNQHANDRLYVNDKWQVLKIWALAF